MKNKKKNFKKDLTLDNCKDDFDTKREYDIVNTRIKKNLIALSKILHDPIVDSPGNPYDYEPPYKIPEPYRAACHLCPPIKLFMSIQEIQQHEKQFHRVWKG